MKRQFLQLIWFLVIGTVFFGIFTVVLHLSILDRLPEAVNLALVNGIVIFLALLPAYKISSMIVARKQQEKMFQF